MVGLVGVFILTAVGGGHVDIATVIVMVIAMDTGAVPGPVTELVIGQAREAATGIENQIKKQLREAVKDLRLPKIEAA